MGIDIRRTNGGTGVRYRASLEELARVAIKEADDLIRLGTEKDPAAALVKAAHIVQNRYKNGVCAKCGKPSAECARRHAKGRLCP
jgi:hypothetical protein